MKNEDIGGVEEPHLSCVFIAILGEDGLRWLILTNC